MHKKTCQGKWLKKSKRKIDLLGKRVMHDSIHLHFYSLLSVDYFGGKKQNQAIAKYGQNYAYLYSFIVR